MCSCVCATGHIKDPHIEKSRASCAGGRLPPIHSSSNHHHRTE